MKLEIGYKSVFEVRKEKYISGSNIGFSILFLSDFHFNKYSGEMAKVMINTIQTLNPTIVLLGGDYIDSSVGMIYLKQVLNSIASRDNVYAIAGNHDYYFGIKQIEQLMIANGIKWLEEQSVRFNINDVSFQIDGNRIGKEESEVDFKIVLLHRPLNIQQFYKNYQLAFAGHLHGCQLVGWQYRDKLYPGCFFYPNNILKAEIGNCRYFVSKGLGDTLPIRYNCKKDMVLVEI